MVRTSTLPLQIQRKVGSLSWAPRRALGLAQATSGACRTGDMRSSKLASFCELGGVVRDAVAFMATVANVTAVEGGMKVKVTPLV